MKKNSKYVVEIDNFVKKEYIAILALLDMLPFQTALLSSSRMKPASELPSHKLRLQERSYFLKLIEIIC